MKREWCSFGIVSKLVALALVLALIGCGQGKEAGNLTAASGGAVSGETIERDVTGVSKVVAADETEEKDEIINWYANKDNVYDISEESEDEDLLVQKKLDGTVVRTFRIKGLYHLGRVTDQWIYYIVYREDDRDEENCCLSELWRIPTGKREDGDHPDLEKKELLLSRYHMSDDFYATDDTIIYLGGEDDDDDEEWMTVYRYDLQTKQSVPLMDGKKLEGAEFVWNRRQEDQGPLMLQGQLFLATEHSLFSMEAESGNWKQIYYDRENEYEDDFFNMERGGKYIYLSPDSEQVYRYRGGDKKAKVIISKDRIQKKLDEICLWGKKGRDGQGSINGVMVYQDRLYLSVCVSWKQRMRLDEYEDEEVRREMIDWECRRTILLSAPVSSPTELTHESAVAAYFKEHSWYVDNMKEGNHHIEDSSIGYISPEKGEILLMMNGYRGHFDSRSYAAYNLTTKKIRKVKRKEAEAEEEEW